MFDAIRQILMPSAPNPAIPGGQRVYAVGDIHGRLDLLAALRTAIAEDDALHPPAETTVVLLGDLIDRGPESAGVIAFSRTWRDAEDLRILCGNHEEMFLESLENLDVFQHFLRFGGRETALSYGIDRELFDNAPLGTAQRLMAEAVPETDIAFLHNLDDCLVIGDYLFVHAGIRPGLPLDRQASADMRWIREPFLSSRADHRHFIVHGHTITPEPEACANRLGIDTGAYMTGRLTALGLEGTRRWLIEAREETGRITVSVRALETV